MITNVHPLESKTAIEQPILSIVIPLHHEGRLFYRTQQAVIRSARYAISQNIAIEVILVLDKANDETIEYIAQNPFPPEIQAIVARVEYGNPGLTRNHGVSLANGAYIALIDGDNLFSENWFSEGVAMLRRHTEDIVVHPNFQVTFGVKQYVWEMIGSNDPDFDPYALAEHNYWDTMCMTNARVLQRFPHDPARTSEGLGYEDWHWNCQTLAAGIEHYVIPKTSFFYRAKADGSMLQDYTLNSTLIPPTQFLSPAVIDSYQRKKRKPRRPQLVTSQLQHAAISEADSSAPVRKPVRSAVLWTARKTGKYPYKAISSASYVHPRGRTFEHHLRPLLRELFKPPGNPPEKPKKTQSGMNTIPDWLVQDWRTLHDIEPSVFPSKHLLPYIHQHKIIADIYTDLYWRFARAIGANQDYVILVPWLKKGGADLEVINYVKGLKELQPTAKIAVIGTNNTSSPWKKFLPEGVTFFTLDKRIHTLAPEHQAHLLGTVLLQLQPKKIHVINSPLGYEVLRKYAKPLSKTSKLFLLIFCLDHTDEGQKVHYVIQYLDDIFTYMTKIFADNSQVVQELVGIYNYTPSRFSVHYQPFQGTLAPARSSKQIPKRFSATRPLRVLWAGRLDTQKRPDILLQINKEVRKIGLPIEFHVYGSAHLSGNKHKRAIQNQAGITYHGPYDKGLETLPLEKYDLFLLTSQWEGMPNVLLEATTGQLPVMAPAVGGIPEFVRPGETGYLIDNFDDISEYIAALKDTLLNYEESQTYLKNAQKLMMRRHSWKNFKRQLQDEHDYTSLS